LQIVERLPSCILEAEMISSGKTHNQVFDNVKKRFRRDGISESSIDKYVNSGVVAEVPLSLKVFDTLKFDGRNMANQPLESRREYTENIYSKGIAPSELTVVDSKPALESLVETTLSMNQEGLVCKDPSSLYLPGHVGTEWVKFKRSEPLDLVVVGVYQTEGVISGALCATYNHETGMYETLGKISTVRIADEFVPLIADKLVEQKPENVLISDKLKKPAYEKFVPYKFVKPEQSVVLEVRAMNIYYSDNWQTCGEKDGKGFSMRIGFAKDIRYDKNSIHATRTSAVRKLYELQKKLEGV
jgi:ATP-dependent DNA ligase